ncbi:hypothetical protein [Aristaeella hokkaidonensis]|uniref:Uncharacterized protein n=1 Tax=Aristaeella hokkaidonensis TaxID=3046382 RepID=A0AC61N6S0_9FIRM|nr:hypothetical protein [Aristaeella hokkaidonensis]QUC67561.1 hypothetical protein JYE49_02340 [Aristaeella hokkaidonensis]SNT92603.1 hypothetical protein SAMN06297421_101148 [Aristaeella hokkaidonensis]
MLRLLKYEFRKTLFPKLVLLALLVIFEGIFLYGYWTGNNSTVTLGLSLFLFTFLCGLLAIGIISLVTLHKDMNTRQGYMLFMTPNSTYRILGAKVAENGLSMLGIGAVGLGICLLNFSLIKQELEFITSFLKNFGIGLMPTFPHLSALLVYIICDILCSVTTAYLADVICSSLLNGQKGSMVITFVLFALLNFGIQKIMGLVPASLDIVVMFLLQGAIALVLATVMYIITARLMDLYLSV